MKTKSRSCPPSAAVEVTRRALRLSGVVSRVGGPAHGAIVSFSGSVRGSEAGRSIGAIEYEAYRKMAEHQISGILLEARRRWPVLAAARHRFGRVPVGEASVIVACSSAHREAAFAAARFIIDRIKRDAPIWKVGFPPRACYSPPSR